MIRIKICCIADAAEARRARVAGADAIGLVSAMPSGPGILTDDRIAAVLDAAALEATVLDAAVLGAAGDSLDTFLLTSRTEPAEIRRQHEQLCSTTLQLCARVSDGPALRAALPDVRLVPVVHVADEQAIEEAVACAMWGDALLLDTGRPSAGELGGTGRTHDWSLSARIRATVPCPVWLAGGLRPDNVAEAVRIVRPYGVDVCSGVRTHGRLDEGKLRAFVRAVR